MKINIPTPCHENWSNMSATERKRFCTLCKQNVHDISTLTESEAQHVFNQPNACTRLAFNQNGQIRIRSGFSSTLLFMAGLSMGCTNQETTTQKTESQQTTTNSDLTENVTTNNNASENTNPPDTKPVRMGKFTTDKQEVHEEMGKVQANTNNQTSKDPPIDCETDSPQQNTDTNPKIRHKMGKPTIKKTPSSPPSPTSEKSKNTTN